MSVVPLSRAKGEAGGFAIFSASVSFWKTFHCTSCLGIVSYSTERSYIFYYCGYNVVGLDVFTAILEMQQLTQKIIVSRP